MNRKQLESRAYVKPEMSVIQTIMEFPLLNGSTIKGGHKKPIINPETGDAKQGWFDEEEDLSEEED
ncbi:hypothetical protein [Hoylesella enoeca]|uniref:Uncharacterized protein n=1 Tax=Hoylesella enoeca TaxID=76123 RepID=A0A0S2KMP3_9BACT|nr:hypothetical protein [Hoylesella enoeca]ALO49390.1 hypothetical protein AS203_10045 [Hoylesella enoeca]